MKRWISLFIVFFMIEGNAGILFGAEKPIPVIFDTDIGSDIDDTWALALILASEELDLKMVVTDSHDTVGKAKIVAKFLETIGRSDIPIGIGEKMDENPGSQYAWARNYELQNYPGIVHEDGVKAMISMILSASEPMTLLVTGPCPNIEAALKQSPNIVQNVRVVAMSGSVDLGYGGKVTPDAEYNVRDAISASEAMYTAEWDLTIAPLDTAGLVQLVGEQYQTLLRKSNPLIHLLLENYREWGTAGKHRVDPDIRSTILYDTVAVYLVFDQSLCEMRDIPLKVDYRGLTLRDPNAKVIHCAMNWIDLVKFKNLIIQRLVNYGKVNEE